MQKKFLQTTVLLGTTILCSSVVSAMPNPNDEPPMPSTPGIIMRLTTAFIGAMLPPSDPVGAAIGRGIEAVGRTAADFIDEQTVEIARLDAQIARLQAAEANTAPPPPPAAAKKP